PLQIQPEVRSSPTTPASLASRLSPMPGSGLQADFEGSSNESAQEAQSMPTIQSGAASHIETPIRSTRPEITVLLFWFCGSILCLVPSVLGMFSLWRLNKVTPRVADPAWLLLLDDSLASL